MNRIIRVMCFPLIMFLIMGAGVITHADQTKPKVSYENGFESGLSKNYFRIIEIEGNTGPECKIISDDVHSGKNAIQVTNSSKNYWTVEGDLIPVKESEIYEFSAYIKKEKSITKSNFMLRTFNSLKEPIDFGAIKVSPEEVNSEWVECKIYFVIPKGVRYIMPAYECYSNGTAKLDDYKVSMIGKIPAVDNQTLSLSNSYISFAIDPIDLSLQVVDKRSNKVWKQTVIGQQTFILTGASKKENTLSLELMNSKNDKDFTLKISLAADKPEIGIELGGSGNIGSDIYFPNPFDTTDDSMIVVPYREGFWIKADRVDSKIYNDYRYCQSLTMPFMGVVEGNQSYMAILNTPYDAGFDLIQKNSRMVPAPVWSAEKGVFGYTRKMTYVFFDSGSIVPMAKRYREEAASKGLIKTLLQKKAENPNVDKLIGAANIWPFEPMKDNFADELKAAGIDKYMVSFMKWVYDEMGDSAAKLLKSDQIISLYEIFNDTMNPELNADNHYSPETFLFDEWPGKSIKNPDGSVKDGWYAPKDWNNRVDSGYNICGILCDHFKREYSKNWASGANFPGNGSFLDTIGIQYLECYDLNHPMTRTESKNLRNDYLKYKSIEAKKITGTEVGKADMVPYLDYSEGIMTIYGGGGIADYDPGIILDKAEKSVTDYDLNPEFRIPLWELVFHDCIVSYTWWGDNNNKYPYLWQTKDLFSILYGNPPIYSVNPTFWENNKDRFAQSYANTTKVARTVGYYEMTDFKYLTRDMKVQKTTFKNGVSVIVNFGNTLYTDIYGTVVKANDYYAYIPKP